jgi:hypothetical protein
MTETNFYWIERRIATMTKRLALLCLLALLFLLAGAMLIEQRSHASAIATEAFRQNAAHTLLSTQGSTFPCVADNVSGRSETSVATQQHPAFSPKSLSTHRLIEMGSAIALFPSSQNAHRCANALLLPMIARTLGLSSLVLRE